MCIRSIKHFKEYRDASGKKQYSHICGKCKMQFASDASERYLKHKETCTNHFKQLQDLPTFDDRIDFLQFNSQYLEEIVIYYDLESLLVPI